MKKIAITLILLLLSTVIFSQNKYALVIGNSNYTKELGSLKNPANDAVDMAKVLHNNQWIKTRHNERD